VDTNFIFECSTRYLTHSLHSLVRSWVKHLRIKPVSKSRHVIFCLLHKHTNDVFDNSVKISVNFPKIFEDFPKLFQRPDECFQAFSEHFWTFSKDCRRWFMKIRRCFHHTSTNLSVVKGTKEKCYKKGMISSQSEK